MPIPKIVHASWKSKDIINNNSIFFKNCLGNVAVLSPDWDIQISDDADVDTYLKDNLDKVDYDLLSAKHIIEKIDVWRLIKVYNEGGLYIDIDRLYNISINTIIEPETKCILPTCADYDFSHDFMCSEQGNPIYKITLDLNLERRYEGYDNIYYLGPQTYFHGITKAMLGESIDINPGKEVMNDLRNMLEQSGFIKTYREYPPYNTGLFKSEVKPFDHEVEKRKFYAETNTTHWTGHW